MPTDGYEPIDKPERLTNRKLWQALSRLPYCEICGKWTGGGHAHHISTRGAGGADSRENMLGACPQCHDKAHWARIGKDRLIAIATDPNRFIPGYDDRQPDA